jgi:hypothetical protein
MNDYQVVAIKFLNSGWRVFNIPNKPAPNGDRPTFLNLDKFFSDRSTSIRFAGYSLNGRLLYSETNQPRQAPRTIQRAIDLYACEDIRGI